MNLLDSFRRRIDTLMTDVEGPRTVVDPARGAEGIAIRMLREEFRLSQEREERELREEQLREIHNIRVAPGQVNFGTYGMGPGYVSYVHDGVVGQWSVRTLDDDSVPQVPVSPPKKRECFSLNMAHQTIVVLLAAFKGDRNKRVISTWLKHNFHMTKGINGDLILVEMNASEKRQAMKENP